MTDVGTNQDPDQPNPRQADSGTELHYPQLLLQASFTSLLSNSVPSSSNSQITIMLASTSPERGLGESWATLSNSDLTSDDDGRSENTETTDPASLVPTDVSEDNQDQDDQEESEQDHQIPNIAQHEEATHPLPSTASVKTEEAKLEDSEVDSKTSTIHIQSELVSPSAHDIPSKHLIEFSEPEQWPEAGQVDLKHTVKIFSKSEEDSLMSPFRVSSSVQLIGTLRMTMSKATLRRDQPFRLLYCGHPDASEARKDILEKFGDILVANTDHSAGHIESSRYQIIPVVLGPGSSPQSDLMQLPFQQMIVDECVDARRLVEHHEVFHKSDLTLKPIQLHYKNGDIVTSEWDPINYRFKTPRLQDMLWDPPDVAVLFIRKVDGRGTIRCREYVQEFMTRHNIPTPVIREDSDWSSRFDDLTFDQQSLHMCIESRPVTLIDPGRILKRMPIDLSTFCNLDPEQLHKHLACQIDSFISRDLKIATKPYHYSTTPEVVQVEAADMEKEHKSSVLDHLSWVAHAACQEGTNPWTHISGWHLLFVFMASVTIMCCIPLAGIFIHRLLLNTWNAMPLISPVLTDVVSNSSSQSLLNTHTATPMSPSATSEISASARVQASNTVSSILAASASLATTPPLGLPGRPIESKHSLSTVDGNTDLAQLLSTAGLETPNRSEQFLVDVIGDCHIIVKMPAKMIPKRKSPALNLRVTRHGADVKSNFSKLFDGVYTVRIERDEAYGQLNLTVSFGKPVVNETHLVEFGSPWWSSMMSLLRSTSWNEAKVRSLIVSARNRTIEDVRSGTTVLSRQARQFLESLHTSFLNGTKDSLRRSDDLKEYRIQIVKQVLVKTGMLRQDFESTMGLFRAKARVEENRIIELVADTALNIRLRLKNLWTNLGRLEIRTVKSYLQENARSESLATAQERVKRMVNDIVNNLKDSRGKSREKAPKHKRAKAPWHDNVRVRW